MPRLEQSQEFLHRQLAEIINQEVALEGILLTVSFVELSPNFKQAKIGLSVLPDKFYGTALAAVRQAGSQIRARLAKQLKWRLVPQLRWEIDNRPKKVAELEEVFKNL